MEERRREFGDLVGGSVPVGPEGLTAGALLIGTTVDPTLDLVEQEQRLAQLALDCSGNTAGDLALELFGSGRFVGNQADYYDPDNSVLPRILDRGVGIPITLSVLFIDVARRRGLTVEGVGMPAHFLTVADGVYYDVFHHGVRLDAEGCAQLYSRLTGGRGRLPQDGLEVVAPVTILQRMLWNLRSIAEGRSDVAMTSRVLALLSAFPDAPLQVRVAYATTLAERGRFDLAASAIEQALVDAPAPARERLQRQADRWSARLN